MSGLDQDPLQATDTFTVQTILSPTTHAVYNTPEGFALARRILAPLLPFDAHDYQLEGICTVMDGQDVLATMVTGGGKTGYFIMLMLVIRAISRDETLALENVTFPKDPAMVVVCPTKALQEDMSLKMQKYSLDTIVINSDTCAEAREINRNLWKEVREGVTMLLLSPEELASQMFAELLNITTFNSRVTAMGVDEIHLLHWWGKGFRPRFRQIGHVRARFPQRSGKSIPLIGVTATLRQGEPLDNILEVLGLVEGGYRLIRRSNVRNDIQIIFQEMKSGLGGHRFPELDWILDEKENTVIFCKTIALGFRVVTYLWNKPQDLPNRDKRIRLYNSLNWPSYNSETLAFLNNNTQSSITVATDTLSVGWDSQFTRNAVIMGEPGDIDEFVQKIGRIGRNRHAVPHPRAFLYYSWTAMATAKKVVDGTYTSKSKSSGRSKQAATSGTSSEETMDLTIAQLLLAACKMKAVDEPYDNPLLDPPCHCKSCPSNPPIPRRDRCNCSGPECEPEPSMDVPPIPKPQLATATLRRPRGEGLNKDLREHGTARFLKLRIQLFLAGDDIVHAMIPPEPFLPDNLIKTLLDHLHLINDVSALNPLVQHNDLLDEQAKKKILDLCLDLKADFTRLREEKKNATTDLLPDSEGEEIEGHDAQVEVTTESNDVAELSMQGSIRWRINAS